MSKSHSMSNNSRVSNSMSNWVSNSMCNRMSNNSGMSNSMGNRMSNSISICSNTIISDISNITIIIIGMIVDMLGTAIRKVDRVGTFYNTSTIIGLSLVEGSTRVVISNSIGVRVGRGLSKVRLGISSNSMVSNNWGMVDNRSMGNSNWVSYGNSMSNANSMSKSYSMSKKCRSSRSCGNESSKTGKRLHVVVLW